MTDDLVPTQPGVPLEVHPVRIAFASMLEFNAVAIQLARFLGLPTQSAAREVLAGMAGYARLRDVTRVSVLQGQAAGSKYWAARFLEMKAPEAYLPQTSENRDTGLSGQRNISASSKPDMESRSMLCVNANLGCLSEYFEQSVTVLRGEVVRQLEMQPHPTHALWARAPLPDLLDLMRKLPDPAPVLAMLLALERRTPSFPPVSAALIIVARVAGRRDILEWAAHRGFRDIRRCYELLRRSQFPIWNALETLDAYGRVIAEELSPEQVTQLGLPRKIPAQSKLWFTDTAPKALDLG